MTVQPEEQPPPLIVTTMSAHEWNTFALLLGALYSVTYDPVQQRAAFVHYDPITGLARPLEDN